MFVKRFGNSHRLLLKYYEETKRSTVFNGVEFPKKALHWFLFLIRRINEVMDDGAKERNVFQEGDSSLMVVSWHYIIIFFLCVSYFLPGTNDQGNEGKIISGTRALGTYLWLILCQIILYPLILSLPSLSYVLLWASDGTIGSLDALKDQRLRDLNARTLWQGMSDT